jgi:RNA polymerase sigma factor (TIGR02999 family)
MLQQSGQVCAPDITRLLKEWSGGDRAAINRLVPHIYNTLRRLASCQLRREGGSHTLQSTALVHEAYLKLIDQQYMQWQNREQFFAVASQIMRRILVGYARKRLASKRGGGKTMLAFDDSFALPNRKEMDLLALDDAMEVLTSMDPRQGRIIELRFFGGLTIPEVASVLGISTATVSRDWTLARMWLHREMSRNLLS